MTKVPASHSGLRTLPAAGGARKASSRFRDRWIHVSLGILLGVAFAASLGFAQGGPKVTGVDPATGKVNDSVTIMGENLGRASVSAVFLSDDKNDFKATLVNQASEKIVIKIPQVKPGGYNVSIQVGTEILIEPVRFTVQG